MFSFPTMPTDNIYKFLTIGGIAMIVASVALQVQIEFGLGAKIELITAQTSEKIESHIRERGGIPTYLPDGRDAAEVSEDLKAFKDAELKLQKAKIDLEIGRFSAYAKQLGNLLSLGYALAFLGFMGWWYRVQMIQDQILILQRDQEREKLNQLKKA